MLKFILLLFALWMAVRLVGRIIRISFITGQDKSADQRGSNSSSFSSVGGTGRVEEAEFEVLDTKIRQDD